MSTEITVEVWLGIVLLTALIGVATGRLATSYLRSDGFRERYGSAPFETLVRLWPRKVALYERASPPLLSALGIASTALLVLGR